MVGAREDGDMADAKALRPSNANIVRRPLRVRCHNTAISPSGPVMPRPPARMTHPAAHASFDDFDAHPSNGSTAATTALQLLAGSVQRQESKPIGQ